MDDNREPEPTAGRSGNIAHILIAAGGVLLLGYVFLSAQSDVSAATRRGASDAYIARVYLSHILHAVIVIGAMLAACVYTRGLSD